MDRRESILKYISKSQAGIEIGPWFSPIAPKRDGYQCLVLDVFDTATLRERASKDPNVHQSLIANIEEVDLIGSSTKIGELIGARGQRNAFDYIVSSHNFEHLPNPIRFLRGCAEALKPEGMLSMAIPDRRGCFDYLRPVTRLSEWIQAFIDERERPTPAQNFDSREAFAHINDGAKTSFAFVRATPPATVEADLDLERLYADWQLRSSNGDENYYDAHCSVFTPASFELLIRDVGFLRLAPFDVVEIVDAGCEFHAHLRLCEPGHGANPADYRHVRNELLHRIQDEAAETSHAWQSQKMESEIERVLSNDTIEAAHARIRELEQSIYVLRRSTTWRATEPLRRGVSMLRALRGKER
ncbi:class I SAM-dependent methyltransferase [Caballeronia sp. ATUFL_F1_KS4A]|uniref:class I SAM-dependent methyltransferase n=1 Tax=Caballeronia sp. ATUFL_F1_KS4A TaxID=2921768 RepID=UPI002027F1DB|nr:class I SAM-dependent methyltransferase [Caballeronia sp. ATUFL_F1_KS4A]